jgi:hypothetical protein
MTEKRTTDHGRRTTDKSDTERLDFLEVFGLSMAQHPYEPRVEVQSEWHDAAAPAVGKTVREAIDLAMNDLERAMARGETSRVG